MTAHRAVVATGEGPAQIQEHSATDLPEGDVTIDVAYSSLNYKDGLAVSGRGKIARTWPMVCGIDLAGTVCDSDSPYWSVGDEVLVTGWGLSETHPGGYSERQRVRSEWLVRRPSTMTMVQTMAVGTAGLTAMLCVRALEEGGIGAGEESEIVVTGAAGGVGSIAVALLANAGFQVAASTGRPETADYLRELGAASIVNREELAAVSSRPLERERWAGGIDTVGSTTLASVLRQTRYRGTVAACGLAAGNDLPTTVLPFILRNIRLQGVDSVQCPTPVRAEAWRRIATDLPLGLLDRMTSVRPLGALPELANQILAGQIQGRVVIDVRA